MDVGRYQYCLISGVLSEGYAMNIGLLFMGLQPHGVLARKCFLVLLCSGDSEKQVRTL